MANINSLQHRDGRVCEIAAGDGPTPVRRPEPPGQDLLWVNIPYLYSFNFFDIIVLKDLAHAAKRRRLGLLIETLRGFSMDTLLHHPQ